MYKRQQCDDVKKQTEIVNEQVKNKISNLDDKFNQINETIRHQIETQSREVENKYVATVEQLEIKTKNEINKQLELRTHVLQNKLEQCELNVVDLTKGIQTIDNTRSELKEFNSTYILILFVLVNQIE